MTRLVWIAMPGNERMAAQLSTVAQGELVSLESRQFPDGETYLRLPTDVSGKQVAVVCTLDHPDSKFLPLAYTAATARELGATRVGLVAPYLAYMRQDRRFKEGEAVTSSYFALLLSETFDWLVTVDPHLHRHASLDEIYTIPNRVVSADVLLAGWIGRHVRQPLIVGPDAESEQWVSRIAAHAQCSYIVLAKRRLGDRQVALDLPDLSAARSHKPVLVDDIISSAGTMIEAARLLSAAGMPKPVCVGIHGLFAGNSFRALSEVADGIVTANTVAHPSNAIDLSAPIALAVIEMVQGAGTRTAAP
jgi:ribose-phosphate pyrophosphokinase